MSETVVERLRKSKSQAEKLVGWSSALRRGPDALDDASRGLLARKGERGGDSEAEATRFLGMHGYNATRLTRLR